MLGVFPSTLSYHHFCVPNCVCKRLKTFFHAEDMKKSAGGLQSAVSPPVGDQEAKNWEVQHIWALRIFYSSLKSIIFC